MNSPSKHPLARTLCLEVLEDRFVPALLSLPLVPLEASLALHEVVRVDAEETSFQLGLTVEVSAPSEVFHANVSLSAEPALPKLLETTENILEGDLLSLSETVKLSVDTDVTLLESSLVSAEVSVGESNADSTPSNSLVDIDVSVEVDDTLEGSIETEVGTGQQENTSGCGREPTPR